MLKLKFGFFAGAAALAVSLTSAPALAENHALLVGVSSYPSLEKALQLVGPANDIKLVQELLLKKGFAPDHVQVLADGVPQAGEPTLKNIKGGLDRLATQVKPGDFVYLHFAGHGSQQPTRPGKVPPEPDGLDEIFLPRDIGKWSESNAAVDNALVNGDMNQAITRLRTKGAFVWTVFDSCHSGNMTRGAPSDEVRFRNVTTASLGIPQAAILAAEKDAPQSRGQAPAKTGAFGAISAGAEGMGGFVAFYAAQTVEFAPEMRLPQGEPNRQPHGLFSYVLAETLLGHEGISYRQLGERVLQRYAALNMRAPTPLFEGTALDAPVFGVEVQARVRQWALKVNKGELSIAAGSLQQFGEGAVFALVPTAVSGDKDIVGYLRADKLTPLSSLVSPIEYVGKPAPTSAQLMAGQYLRLVDPNLRLSLRVALPASPPLPRLHASAPASPKVDSALEKVARQLIADLRAKPIEGVRIEWVEPGQNADLRLRLSDDKLWLLPPDGQFEKNVGPNKSYSIDLKAPKERVGQLLVESFQSISKTTNLLRVASFFGSKDSAGPAKGLVVTATIVKRDAPAPIPFNMASLPEFRTGDRIEFVFQNKGQAMVDVTALFLDSNYGITALYPAPGRLNRIEVGAKDSLTLEVNADTTGAERLMILAVDAQPQTATTDFSFLAQPELPKTRGYVTSIDVLMRETGFGVTTRGVTATRSPMGDADIKVFGWRTVGD